MGYASCMTPPAPDAAILTRDLRKHYGEVRAVDGVDLEIARGECFGLLGHNGAGKSTTIRMLTCRTDPTSGGGSVLGHDVVSDRPSIRPRINLVGDRQNLHPRLTGRATLRFWADLYGTDASRVDELLLLVGLDPDLSRPMKDYSTGMRQRVIIARSLINAPEVLFLDEPTRGLDPASSRTLRGIVHDLVEQGTTVFLTTHDMAEADELCDRIAFMSEGRIVALGTPRALRLDHAGDRVEADVTLADGSEHRVRLDRADDRARLEAWSVSGDLRTVHTREPTLADVFVAVAGRPLDAGAVT
ncbi:MAG: transporter related protein [Thermoleophilia bacterium]|nr:transporter related protein [Thermoleophilia bacterium]